MSENAEYIPSPEKETQPDYAELSSTSQVLIDMLGITVCTAEQGRNIMLRIDPEEALRLADFIALHRDNLEAFRASPQRIPLFDSAAGAGGRRLSLSTPGAGPEPIPVNQ